MAQPYQSNRGGQRRPQMVFMNEQIKAPTIIIVDTKGGNLGTFPRRKALEFAEEKGLDLVQMNYDRDKMVSTVKLVDYGKYMYKKQKADKEKKKTQKVKGFKELKFRYMIGDNDLALKVKKAQELLEAGYNVKLMVRLRGRERIYGDTARRKLKGIVEELADYGRSQFVIPKKEAQGYSISLFTKVK